MLKKIWYFFSVVSRGYSLPTSLTSFLVGFSYCFKISNNPKLGLIAGFGVICAHLGTNLFDDVIDIIFKVPKQKCKTEYLDKKIISFKAVAISAILYFLAALICGVYVYLNTDIRVLFIAIIAAFIILLYPKLNHFALGEIAVGAVYGVLLFSGISISMTGVILKNMLLISIPVSLFVVNLLFAHSLMDFDFDKINNKKTLCVRFKTKENALKLFILITLFAIFSHMLLIIFEILPKISLISLLPTVLLYAKAIKGLKQYITKTSAAMFLPNFKTVCQASMFYNILLSLTILFK